MASEDSDKLVEISSSAGQISRDKNDASAAVSTTSEMPAVQATSSKNNHGRPPQLQYSTSWAYEPGGYAARGGYFPRGGFAARRGYVRARSSRGGRPPQIYRNKTLVLNGSPKTSSDPAIARGPSEEGELPSASPVRTGASFVTKTDRHMQLINTDVYQKEAQARSKAIAESRQQKLLQKDQREKAKLRRYLQRSGGRPSSNGTIATAQIRSTANHEITIEDVQFRVAKNGSKLVKLPGDLRPPNATPKTALVGGVRFHRSKNGNLYRAGIMKAHRRNTLARKVNQPCKTFTLTGICSKGPKCPYQHDPSKVAACKEFLLKGSCSSGDSCDLSHDLTPERTPFCLHFAKGTCANPNCRYAHVRVSPTAPVCRPFAINGYCEKGSTCEDRHVHECPDFSNTGTCHTKGCKLPHHHKANVMRRNQGPIGLPDNSSDLSSDEDGEEIASDDVDSDDFDEEWFGDETNASPDILMEQDYLQLS